MKATENLPLPTTPPTTATAAESLHSHASEIYDVLALLDALATIGEDDRGFVSADTVTRVANLAHRTLLAITTEANLEAIRQILDQHVSDATTRNLDQRHQLDL